jgi:N-acetylneuraminate synthase
MFGPDAKASLTIDEVKGLVEGVKKVRQSLLHDVEKDEAVSEFIELKNLFGKSLCVNASLPQDHIISFNDLETKKPAGFGIAPSAFKSIVGKRLARPIEKWAFLNPEDLKP